MKTQSAGNPDAPIRVLVDDGCLAGARTGVGQYLASILDHWPNHPSVELCCPHRAACGAFPATPAATLGPVRLRPLAAIGDPRTSLRRRIARFKPRWWHQARSAKLTRRFHRERFDLFFEPNCIAVDQVRPTVTAMMDLSVLELPETHPWDRRRYWEWFLPSTIAHTAHWIAISGATASAMQRLLGIPRNKIAVVPLASRWAVRESSAGERQRLRVRLGLPDRYVLCLGTIEPRKNVLRLLDAYLDRPATWRSRTKLILAGMPGWGPKEFWRRLRAHPAAREVLFTGYLEDERSAAMVQAARALVYPSLYEGFGLPAVEAMALGTPVVASDIPSLQEACGEAARLVSPEDPAALGEAIESICEPGLSREILVEAGRRQAGRYSWSAAAAAHHDLFARIAGRNTLTGAA